MSQVVGVPGVPDYSAIALRARQSDLALVIPVLNEGDRLISQLKKIRHQRTYLDVVIADGGSTDGATTVDALGALDVTTLLCIEESTGLSAQLRMAIHYCLENGYRGIVTMDGNGKDGAEGIGRIASMLRRNYDFVQGSRFARGGRAQNTPPIRYMAIRCIHSPLTSLASAHWYSDTTNGFRGFSRRLLEDPRVGPLRDVFANYELLAYMPIRAARLGYRVAEVGVSRTYPKGESTPTKIRGLRSHSRLLGVLLKASAGAYDPS